MKHDTVAHVAAGGFGVFAPECPKCVEHKAALDAHVARVVAEAPPLTVEQKAQIAALLRPFAP